MKPYALLLLVITLLFIINACNKTTNTIDDTGNITTNTIDDAGIDPDRIAFANSASSYDVDFDFDKNGVIDAKIYYRSHLNLFGSDAIKEVRITNYNYAVYSYFKVDTICVDSSFYIDHNRPNYFSCSGGPSYYDTMSHQYAKFYTEKITPIGSLDIDTVLIRKYQHSYNSPNPYVGDINYNFQALEYPTEYLYFRSNSGIIYYVKIEHDATNTYYNSAKAL